MRRRHKMNELLAEAEALNRAFNRISAESRKLDQPKQRGLIVALEIIIEERTAVNDRLRLFIQ